MSVIQIQAKKHSIVPAVIATRKQLATMVQAGEEKLSNDWRGALVNKEIGQLMSGQLSVTVENGITHLVLA
jgi:Mrp family chromosome partitioning ATPase